MNSHRNIHNPQSSYMFFYKYSFWQQQQQQTKKIPQNKKLSEEEVEGDQMWCLQLSRTDVDKQKEMKTSAEVLLSTAAQIRTRTGNLFVCAPQW